MKLRTVVLFILLATVAVVAQNQTVTVDGPIFTIDVPKGDYQLDKPWVKDYEKTTHHAFTVEYNGGNASFTVGYSDAKAGNSFESHVGSAEDEDHMNDSALGAYFNLSTTTVVRGYATIAGMTARSATVVGGVDKNNGKTITLTVRAVILRDRIWDVTFRQVVGAEPNFTVAQGEAVLDSIKLK